MWNIQKSVKILCHYLEINASLTDLHNPAQFAGEQNKMKSWKFDRKVQVRYIFHEKYPYLPPPPLGQDMT